MSYKTITQQSYQATAKEFTQKVAELAPLGSIEKFIRYLPHQGKIIDLGCGSGRDAKIFTDNNLDVVGIDFSSNLIDIAREYAPKAIFHVMDFETLSFPENSFDGAWAGSSLCHLEKAAFPKVFKNLHSIVKSGGTFYLSLKKGSGEKLEVDERYEGSFEKFWSFFEEDEIKKILIDAGFELLEFVTVEKRHQYQSHPFFRIFCQKI